MTELIYQKSNIAFIGCGNMASAIIGGLVQSGWPASKVMASNPSAGKLDKLKDVYSIKVTHSNSEAAKFADIIVLAVKPQKLPDVCAQLAKISLADKLIISVAAGYTTSRLNKELNQQLMIVRAMPNTPALIQQGATGLYATPVVTEAAKQLSEKIFESVGITAWIKSEAQMDTVTAIAGSSPAYVFLLMQAMAEQAVASGIDEESALTLVTQAVSGAAQLAQASPEKTLIQLRREVTSPGGTTAAAITSFIDDNFEGIVKKAVQAATNRGKELGK
ncbi:pyrroline-5-carboxylate reductase [Aliikangiella sp. G2MR2-5]|uniref:pyrroline-5-carboxylate reductase n=1 Tax=Aliikangiella sp. G2MR2-5 TaxID=2788943 RepID=UPI0018AC1476|nr:pyrroline-5-carboxylate reductase [Aliikangiella sp. G2MR2-5]